MQHMSTVDQLQVIDQQLLRCELSQGEQAAVDEFRVWSSQQRQKLANEAGSFPDDQGERASWQARKQLREKELDADIMHERLLRGKLGNAIAIQTESPSTVSHMQGLITHVRRSTRENGCETCVEESWRLRHLVLYNLRFSGIYLDTVDMRAKLNIALWFRCAAAWHGL